MRSGGVFSASAGFLGSLRIAALASHHAHLQVMIAGWEPLHTNWRNISVTLKITQRAFAL